MVKGLRQGGAWEEPEELKGGQPGGEIVGIDQAVWPRAPYVDNDPEAELI